MQQLGGARDAAGEHDGTEDFHLAKIHKLEHSGIAC
ncbi:Uncharacterised protein [Mycobacterium tuberculosis]|nr:Uncharacterised protein [Mycobacterium tuberculosis]